MTKLEKATHIFLITVCCVSLAVLIEARVRLHSLPSTLAPTQQSNLVGKSLSLPGMDWNAAPLNIVLQISATCHFCSESMPFYQRLAAACNRQGGKAKLVVSSQDAVRTMQDHLGQQHVVVDNVLQSRMDALGIIATPTILVVDSRGVVKRVFVGKLDESREREMLSIVERGAV